MSSLSEKKPVWILFVSFFRIPLIFVFSVLHFLICTVLTIFVHPDYKRLDCYEYYCRWGWGMRLLSINLQKTKRKLYNMEGIRKCDHSCNADINAARNILERFLSGPYGAAYKQELVDFTTFL